MTVQPALEPTIFVIFGITGDLAKRKLLPALYRLVAQGLLHEQTVIVGVTRKAMTLDEFLVGYLPPDGNGADSAVLDRLRRMIRLERMDVTDGAAYDALLERLNALEGEYGVCMNRLYYLSIPPQVALPIVRLLGSHGHNRSCQHGTAATRLLLEKPFGFDLASAQELVVETSGYFDETQLFRIDHYLAKETVQNILAFRFNNPIFEPIWNARHIERIEIVAAERIGIEGRGHFYEMTGALRDLIQSHLLQVLALVTMEQPVSIASADIHAQKLRLLNAIATIEPDQVATQTVRGQYDGYRDEADAPRSRTETFAAVRLSVANQRWSGIPVVVRTGKALAAKTTHVHVVFRPTESQPHHNVLTFRLQPNEGIELDLRVKKPGFDNALESAGMEFSYGRSFNGQPQPDAYERVLVDAVRGDHTLFTTGDEVLESWRILDHVLAEWAKTDDGLHGYAPGSMGPAEAERL